MIIEKNNIKLKFINSINRVQANELSDIFFKYLGLVLEDEKYNKFLKCVDFKVKGKNNSDAYYVLKDKTITIFNLNNLEEAIYHELVHVKFFIKYNDLIQSALDEKIFVGFKFLNEYFAYYETSLYFYNQKPNEIKSHMDNIWNERELVFDDIEGCLQFIEKIQNSEDEELKAKTYLFHKDKLKEYKEDMMYYTARWLGNLSVYNQIADEKISITSDMNFILNYINNMNKVITTEDFKNIGGLL